MNMSDYMENRMIDQIFRAQSFSFPGSLYFALFTTTPTDTFTGSSAGEVTGGSYARQTIVCGTATFYNTQGTTVGTSTGTGGTTSQVNAITYPAATADWGTVVGILITDSGTTAAGNSLFWSNLVASKVVGNGDTFQFAAGNLSCQIDN